MKPPPALPCHHVLVLDSGVGGLTIVAAIRALSPSPTITYLADTAWFPYGALRHDALANRVCALVIAALARTPADAVVVACNTASTVVLPALRAAIPVPVIGVVPPIKPAGVHSRSRVIGLLATEGTVNRPYIDDLIASFAADCHVIRVGCRGLAEQAERKLRGHPPDETVLRTAVAPLLGGPLPPPDVVILGCTHYPLLHTELATLSGLTDALWLDSARPVAERLHAVLAGSPPRTPPSSPETAWFTATADDTGTLIPVLTRLGFTGCEAWRI